MYGVRWKLNFVKAFPKSENGDFFDCEPSLCGEKIA